MAAILNLTIFGDNFKLFIECILCQNMGIGTKIMFLARSSARLSHSLNFNHFRQSSLKMAAIFNLRLVIIVRPILKWFHWMLYMIKHVNRHQSRVSSINIYMIYARFRPFSLHVYLKETAAILDAILFFSTTMYLRTLFCTHSCRTHVATNLYI
jgi:hypothetical protein